MNLFGRRPLCVFCFFFFMTALLVYSLQTSLKWSAMILFGVVSLFLLLLAVLLRKYRIQCLTVFFCVLSVFLSLANSFLRVDYPQMSAEKYFGKHTAAMTILSEEEQKRSSSEYLVTVTQIDQESVRYRCLLLCPFVPDLSSGDQVYAAVEFSSMGWIIDGRTGYDRTDDEQVTMVAYLPEASGAKVRKLADDSSLWNLLSMPSGIQLATQRIQMQFSDRVDSLFDSETASMVKALFVSDKSSISSLVLRDFRRCGVSHLLAVSGLHFSILLGILEWFLCLFRVPKQARCVLSSFFAIVFLAMTGFALSACRSAFMLLMVYLNFLLQEDHDSPTALFVSLAVILLMFPHAVNDLGLWMSFLATLGLVTVFPWVNEKIPYWTHKNKLRKRMLKLCRSALQGVVITLIANFFLLPISWYYFGEISLVSLIVNLILSPPSAIILPLILVALLLGAVPILGAILIQCIRILCRFMVLVVRLFSEMKFATVSLNTKWADMLIPVFTLAMVLVLLLPLRKHKWITLLPAVFVSIALTVCGCVSLIFDTPRLTYLQQTKGDFLILQENKKTVVCDVSDGNLSEAYTLISEVRALSAVQIDCLILTHCHRNHDSMLEILHEQLPVAQIAIPMPKSEEEYLLSYDVAEIASEYGVNVIVYEKGDPLQATSSVSLTVEGAYQEKEPSISVLFHSEDQNALYINPSADSLPKELIYASDTVFFGIHGENLEKEESLVLVNQREDVLWIFPNDMSQWSKAVRVEGYAKIFSSEQGRKSITLDFQ